MQLIVLLILILIVHFVIVSDRLVLVFRRCIDKLVQEYLLQVDLEELAAPFAFISRVTELVPEAQAEVPGAAHDV